MNDRPCIRCQQSVLLEDGHLVYCSHCGAPQIFLSEQLQTEIAQQAEDYQQRLTPKPAAAAAEAPAVNRRWRSARSRQSWPRAIQYALLSAAITLGLGLFTFLFPPATVLLLLWAVTAPMLTVAFFVARSVVGPPPSSGFAARLGLLTGMLVSLAGATVSSGILLFARFVQHDAATIDAQMAAFFAQERTAMLERMGAAAQPALDLLTIPEFRVGLLLCVIATAACIYLLLSTLSAGLTGLVLGRRRPA